MNKPLSTGLKNTFLIHCLVALLFGFIFLFFPGIWENLAGIKIREHAMYRMVGAAVLAFGFSSWLAYRAKNWENVRILLLTEILWTALAAAISLYYLIRWSFPPLYWLVAILMAVFAALFTFFYIKNG